MRTSFAIAGLTIALLVACAAAGSSNDEAVRRSMIVPLRQNGALPLTAQEKEWVSKTLKVEKNGWLYVNISGEAYERGFQHGYALADEYDEALQTYQYFALQTIGMPFSFFVDMSVKLHKNLIGEEYTQEMQGIADGLTKAGVATTLEEVIGWNGWMELSGYWWPLNKGSFTSSMKAGKHFVNAHCSAFGAVGNASAPGTGGGVLGHTTFIEFWADNFNVIMTIKPTSGADIIMQTGPGYIASMTDFYVTSAGLIVTETTIANFVGYDDTGIPEYVRARNATQYATDIDSWIAIMQVGNNGGYANMWDILDCNKLELAEFEQGLLYQYTNKVTDGYVFGDNVPNSPEIRNLEVVDSGYSDTRAQTGARRTRWPQLLNENYGKIDLEVGQTMLADDYDPYLKEYNHCSRNIGAMYDLDPQYYYSDPSGVWPTPYTPAGSIDGKVATCAMAKQMQMSGRFGRSNGIAFDADSFLEDHPEWAWQAPFLQSRPSQPWTTFQA